MKDNIQSAPAESGATINPTEVNEVVMTASSYQEEESDTADIPNIITAKDLALVKAPTSRYLLEPYLPVTGTALIAGQPDTGKSQFARQLAIQITQGSTSFLDFKLKTKHQRAIYVATEDDAISCQYLMLQQHKGLGYEPNENLTFFFADGSEVKGMVEKLNSLLAAKPADIVVVDGFGDIFHGKEMNSNTQMREAVNPFSDLAKKHNCLVFFVHHINKGAYDKDDNSQKDIQGGSGLTQKVRLAWVLSPRGDGLRQLKVTKGNYCPAEYKKKPLLLNFSQDTFIFSMASAESAQLELFQEPSINKNEAKLLKALPSIQEALIASKGMKHGELVELLYKSAGIPESSAKRLLSELKNGEYFKHDPAQALYFWNEPLPALETTEAELNNEEENDLGL